MIVSSSIETELIFPNELSLIAVRLSAGRRAHSDSRTVGSQLCYLRVYCELSVNIEEPALIVKS